MVYLERCDCRLVGSVKRCDRLGLGSSGIFGALAL